MGIWSRLIRQAFSKTPRGPAADAAAVEDILKRGRNWVITPNLPKAWAYRKH